MSSEGRHYVSSQLKLVAPRTSFFAEERKLSPTFFTFGTIYSPTVPYEQHLGNAIKAEIMHAIEPTKINIDTCAFHRPRLFAFRSVLF